MIEVIDFGIKDYPEILELQTKFFDNLINAKLKRVECKEYILIGEHLPVITLGRHAKETNILVNEDVLERHGIKTYQIGRGGDVTYHAPGQMVVYPILDLGRRNLGIKDYVKLLEETVIRLLKRNDITGERVFGATGVWIGKGTKEERKISAIGIKCSRFCTMHGLSLNVNCDLRGFKMINPCGFQDKGVTSIELERGKIQINKEQKEEFTLEINKIKKEFLDIFLSLVFSFQKNFNFLE